MAILSCLVQQRRKRDKELNGGISPEKMNNKTYSDDGSLSMNGSEVDEDDKNSCIDDDDDQESQISCTEQDTNERLPTQPKHNDHSYDSVNIKVECDSDTGLPIENENVDDNIPRDVELTTFNKKDNDVPQNNIKCEYDWPKMPVFEYINPHKVCKQIDELLSSTYLDADQDEQLNYVPIELSSDRQPCEDLILVSTPKDFVEIVNSIVPGPLRYSSVVNLKKRTGLSSFVMKGRKRRNNKTGWPTPIKRRSFVKKENELVDDDEDSMCSISNTDGDEDTIVNNGFSCNIREFNEQTRNVEAGPSSGIMTSGNTVDLTRRLETMETDEYFIRSRQKLNSLGEDCSKDDEFSNDCNHSVLFASSSEKAENSDIFTVSSDSLDTTDLTAEQIHKQSVDHNNKDNKEYDNVLSVKSSLVNLSDESSSADITLAEMLKKQIGVRHQQQPQLKIRKPSEKRFKTTNNKYLTNMCLLEDISGVRESRITGDTLSDAINTSDMSTINTSLDTKHLQPIIRVRKITVENDISNIDGKLSSTSNSSSIPTTAAAATINCINRKSCRTSCSPQSKFSPPKLRKPRGKWYCER